MSEEEKKVKKPKSKARKIIEWVLTGVLVAIFAVLGIAQIDGMVHKKDHFGQMLKFGYGTFVVQTESMEPTYKKGYALVTYYDDADKLYQMYQEGKQVDAAFYYDNTTVLLGARPEKAENQALTELLSVDKVPYPIITHRIREIQVNEGVEKGNGKYTIILAGINDSVASATDQDGNICQYQAVTEKALLGRVVVGSAFLGAIFSFVSSIWGLLILLLIPAFYLIITSVIDIFKAYKEPEEAPAAASNNGETTSNSGTLDLSEEDKKRLKEELLEEMLNKKKGGN